MIHTTHILKYHIRVLYYCSSYLTFTYTGQLFPWKLHDMLRICKSEGNESIVSWLPPHGNRFKVHNVPTFVSNILPLFFKQTKFKSFQRQLNLWGFLRIQDGPEKGAYYHKQFLQDQPDLCRLLTRQKASKKVSSSSSIITSIRNNVDSNNTTTNRTTTNAMITDTDTTVTSIKKEKKKLANARQRQNKVVPTVLTSGAARNPPTAPRKLSIDSLESNSISDHLLEKFDENCFDTFDLEEFEGFTFYHLEQDFCSKEFNHNNNNNNNSRNDGIEINRFTPATETHQIQQDTISLLKELEQDEDYGLLPKMIFNTSLDTKLFDTARNAPDLSFLSMKNAVGGD